MFRRFMVAQCSADSGEDFRRAKAMEDAGRKTEARAAFDALAGSKATAPHDIAGSLMELSRIHLGAGNYAESIAKGERAVKIFHSLDDSGSEGNALTILGLSFTYQGNYNRALEILRTALNIAHQSHDLRQEITRRNNISTVYYFQGRYADALDELQAAMRLVDSSPEQEWNASRRQLTTANIAIVYQTLGQYDRALETYARLRSSTGSLEPQEQAQLLVNMGALYRRLGDPIKALATYASARKLYQQRELVSGQIAVLNNIGIANALDLHQLDSALRTFNEALRLATLSSDKLGVVQTLLYRAQTYYLMGRLRESKADFEKALIFVDSSDASEEKWKALYGIARIAQRSGDSSTTMALLQQAVALIESLRGSGPSSLRTGFLADKRQVYDLLIEEMARASQPNAAELFRLMELSRSRSVQDRRQFPETKISLDQTRRRLIAGTLLLEYWLSNDSMVIFWATGRDTGVHFQAGLTGIRERLRSFRTSLSDPLAADWRASATSISTILLDGVAPQLSTEGIRNLVIVPDREISLIPMEVLPLPSLSNQRIVDRYAVSYLPSALLVEAQARPRRTVPFWRRTLLAFGDPAPNGSADSVVVPSDRDSRRLPAAREEVQSLGAITGGRTSIFTGLDASKQNLRAGLQLRFPLIHFATHAFSDPENPARSYILLAGANKYQAYDYLFLDEFQNLDLKGVDLITLSACETENGKLVEGEGVSGFSKVLLAAGASSVVTSLWEVGDQPSARLMKIFYREMASGIPASEALRRAKVEFATQSSSHPFYWSAFVLNGQPDVTLPRVVGWLFPLAILIGILGAIILFRSRRRTHIAEVSK